MILILKNRVNQITVTATELTTSNSDVYRFVFTGDQKQKQQEIELTDISLYPQRYNLFEFEEGVDITFKSRGDYEYRVYDSNDVLVEIGKARVIDENEAPKIAYSFPNENNIVYS